MLFNKQRVFSYECLKPRFMSVLYSAFWLDSSSTVKLGNSRLVIRLHANLVTGRWARVNNKRKWMIAQKKTIHIPFSLI